jgi:hypothetical protein
MTLLRCSLPSVYHSQEDQHEPDAQSQTPVVAAMVKPRALAAEQHLSKPTTLARTPEKGDGADQAKTGYNSWYEQTSRCRVELNPEGT